jgi:hypothetical protein
VSKEGATVAASPLTLQLAASMFVRPFGSKQRNPNHRERLINYQKCPNYETPAFSVTTELTNEHSFMNETSSKQMNKQIKQRCRMSLKKQTKHKNVKIVS